jgi:hypothetical protein
MAAASHFNRDGLRTIDRSLYPVSWRWLPPAYSPITARFFLSGVAGACGTRAPSHEHAVEILCERFGASDVLLTDSGTSALMLALRAMVPAGGPIAYPGYSCIDLTTAAVGAGTRVRLYDLDPVTLSPDLDSLRKTIERGVDAIVVAHLYGYPADMTSIQRLARDYGTPVIEDSAQGAGGTLHGVRLGGIGDISVLSFGRGKGATTGSGGAVLVRTPALVEWMQQARNDLGEPRRGGRELGSLGAQWVFSHPLLYRIPASIPALKLGQMVYHPPKQPRGMPAAATMMLPSVLGNDDYEVDGRRERANDLLSRINGSRRLNPVRPVGGGASGYLRLALADATGHLATRPSLGAIRGYPLTLEQHQQLRPMLAEGERAGMGSILLRDRLFTLPTHSRLASSDLANLADWIGAIA